MPQAIVAKKPVATHPDLCVESLPRKPHVVTFDDALGALKLAPGVQGLGAVLEGWTDPIGAHDQKVIEVEQAMLQEKELVSPPHRRVCVRCLACSGNEEADVELAAAVCDSDRAETERYASNIGCDESVFDQTRVIPRLTPTAADVSNPNPKSRNLHAVTRTDDVLTIVTKVGWRR